MFPIDASTGTDVIIVGGGPVGLMLACELRLAGSQVLVLEKEAGPATESRAGGLHARTAELFHQRGLIDRFLAGARQHPVLNYSGIPVPLAGTNTPFPFVISIMQATVLQRLLERAKELDVQLVYGAEVTMVHQDDQGVEVSIFYQEEAHRLHASYIVACDGGRSGIRKQLEIPFQGTDASLYAMQGDVRLSTPPENPIFLERREHGVLMVLPIGPGIYRVSTIDYNTVNDRQEVPTFEQLRASLLKVAGTDFGMHSPIWITSYHDAARQIEQYRHGRLLFAGDAAHIHLPAGGQGLNTGLQDAVNLGWKLALVAQGLAPDSLLDTYHAERYPVAERVLENTRAQTALMRPGAQTTALREQVKRWLQLPEAKQEIIGMISALDLRYPTEEVHPLAGLRLHDLPLQTSSGKTHTYAYLHTARGALFDLGNSDQLADLLRPYTGRVQYARVSSELSHWPLPVTGEVPTPQAVLVRPDGHVVWVAEQEPDLERLATVLERWFGPVR